MDAADTPPRSYLQYLIDHRESTLQTKNQAYYLMDQIYGWCSHSKASILIDIIHKIKPAKIVEIGVWGGRSLIPMAYTLKGLGHGKIYGIDPWDSLASVQGVQNEANQAFWSSVDHEATYKGLVHFIDRFELQDQVELIRDTSAHAPSISEIDLLHIDGNHSDETSYQDITKWGPLVNRGGWIILDDITWYENGAYTQARSIEWLNNHCLKMAEIHEDCDWGIWVKK
jgi:predicted O-methyltransferase YrrM